MCPTKSCFEIAAMDRKLNYPAISAAISAAIFLVILLIAITGLTSGIMGAKGNATAGLLTLKVR
jgi:hypothetical protein